MTEQAMRDPGPESGSGARFTACLNALIAWRDAQVRDSKVPLGALKITDLKRAITHGRRDPRLIANVIPADARHLAPQIVDVIMGADPATAARGSATAASAPPITPGSTQPAAGWPLAPLGSAGPLTGAVGHQPPAPFPSGRPPAPELAHLPQPTAPDPAPAPAPGRDLEFLARRASEFAALDFSEEIGQPAPLRTRLAAGVLELSWDAVPISSGHVTYRVVSAEDYPPYAPELAPTVIDITNESETGDESEFTAAVRYVQVWSNAGRTAEAARRAQPRLHAQAAVVAPVQGLSLQEDSGKVIGEWAAFPGTSKVHVYRVPIERAAQVRPDDPTYAIATDSANLTGFIDRTAERGRRYLYRCFAEASVDGVARLSSAVVQSVAVSAVLTAVNDLRLENRTVDGSSYFDLTWSDPPAGRVVIFRTDRGPAPGVEAEARDESVLSGAGLSAERRLRHPVTIPAPSTSQMAEVPSPEGWERVYFTPVTVVEGRVQVGRTVSAVVIPQVTDAVIVERTDHQLLKFGWPGTAAAVAVGVGATTAEPEVPRPGGGYLEVSRDAYRRLGGVQLPRLRAQGCSVHLAGVAFNNRERFYGSPAMVQYAGLLRLSYVVEVKLSLMRRPDRVLVRISAERELANCPPFVLVHNPTRLPLALGDGEPLEVELNVDGSAAPRRQFRPPRLDATPCEPAYRASVKGRSGFVRLFVDLPADRLQQVALLDPALSSLLLQG